MSRDEETITTTAAERRLGGALMWTGVMLGAMFIAVLGLGFMVYTTSYAPNGTVATLTAANKDLQTKLDAKTDALTKKEQDYALLKKANDDLIAQNSKKPGKKPSAPVVNPY